MADAMIAHPIVFDAASYVLRVTCNLVTANVTFSVTPGRYYWTVGDGQADTSVGGGVGDLLLRLQAAINAHPEAPACTVTLTSDFRVRVSVPAGTIRLLWGNVATTLDGTIFGFDADTALDAAVTGGQLPRGLWRAGKPVSEPDTRDRSVYNGGISETLSGRYRVSDFGAAPRERRLAFRLLNRVVSLDEYATASAPYGTWEQAWASMRRGRPFRLYADETQREPKDYALYRTRTLSDPLVRDEQFPVRWAADLEVARHA
jgi:hypothetical protein